MMIWIKTTGRIFYGLAMTGIGLLHFFLKGFRPLISATQPENPDEISTIIYLFGLYLIISGILIVLGKKLKPTSLLLGYVLILFLIFGHLPERIVQNPTELGRWTNALKLLALIGGAFLISISDSQSVSNKFISKLSKLAPFGRYFFGVMLIVFGIDHFIYLEFVSGLVPKWIPFSIFWTYLT